jgi:choice-of-anchor A domain-containing protein
MGNIMLRVRSLVLLLTAIAGAQAQASVLNLNQASGGANVFVFHDFTSANSDVEGALVAGGNITLSSYAVNLKDKDAYGSSGYALVAGGNLTLTNGSIYNGNAYVGGTSTLTGVAQPPVSNVKPVDFAQAQATYTAMSTSLSKLGATGTAGVQYNSVQLTGSGTGGVDVFNVSSSLFSSQTNSWALQNLVAGQTLIFNVSGATAGFNNGNFGFDPLAGYNVLFNFYQATTVDVKGVIGSILAPYATVRTDYGLVRGNVIADAWNGYSQVNYEHTFQAVDVPGLNTGSLPAAANVPEPGSIALVLGGLLAAAAVRRRVR